MTPLFQTLLIMSLLFFIGITESNYALSPDPLYSWTVIGAGPAGLASIGKLLDAEIPQHEICWIDPNFEVGDFGKKWSKVPSNTPVKLFKNYLLGCKSFKYHLIKENFLINSLPDNVHCLIEGVVEPMKAITNLLRKKVHTIELFAQNLELKDGYWHIRTDKNLILSKNVILCTGSVPKLLQNTPNAKIIPLDIALNPSKLRKVINKTDVVGVFGSSHSAVLVLKNLHILHPKQIINIYQSAQRYSLSFNNEILFDNTGLKGVAAKWSREYIDGACLNNLKRYHISNKSYQSALSRCNKVIYAIGFEKRALPKLTQFPEQSHHKTTGIIAPGLFGLGIAFPKIAFDSFGNLECQIGIWDFMKHLDQVLPLWKEYGNF